jgi:hypothetical protein
MNLARMTIGLGVSAQQVRAVSVVSSRIEWALQLAREPGRPLVDELEEMLRHAALRSWPRRIAMAAIGPFASQTKLLSGLPVLQQVDEIRSVVREGASRFFLRKGEALIISGVRPTMPGSAWATAYDESLVREIESACQRMRLPLRLIAPSVLAITRATTNERMVWHDGDVSLQIEIVAGELRKVCRTPNSAYSTESVGLIPALEPLGKDAWQYADAYGVTQLSRNEPLVLRLGSKDSRTASRPRDLRMTFVASAVSITVAAAAPGVSGAIAARQAESRLRSVAVQRRDVVKNEHELERITNALSEVSTYDRSRHSAVTLLGSISHALPIRSALVDIHYDSVGGTAVLLTDHSVDALAVIASLPVVRGSEIIGPVTKELSAGREMERVTVRFRFSNASRSP